MRNLLTATAALAVAVFLAACGEPEPRMMICTDGVHKVEIVEAIAVLQATSGSQVKGTVHFKLADGKMAITADVEGLTPGAKHAIHIHEFGDLSAADGASAGGHFNPEGHHHGAPDGAEHHAGDLGNLQADANGKAHYELTVAGLTICDANAIIGRGVVVHAKVDDFGQPVGNAGPRIAVGVIGIAKVAAPAAPAAAPAAPAAAPAK